MTALDEIDAHPLRQLCDLGGIELAQEMVALFNAHFLEMAGKAEQALQTRNLADFAFAIHAVKSSLNNVGAVGMAEAAAEMENSIGDNRVNRVQSSFNQFVQVYPLIARSLSEMLEKLKNHEI